MKRRSIKIIAAVLLLSLIGGYICLMALFERPIRVDLTHRLQFSAAEPEIELPWIYRWFTHYEGQTDGYDSEGYRYTQYDYTLPDIFESAEMHCIVDWRTESAVAFIGDSRAMEVISSEFPSVRWNFGTLKSMIRPAAFQRRSGRFCITLSLLPIEKP